MQWLVTGLFAIPISIGVFAGAMPLLYHAVLQGSNSQQVAAASEFKNPAGGGDS